MKGDYFLMRAWDFIEEGDEIRKKAKHRLFSMRAAYATAWGLFNLCWDVEGMALARKRIESIMDKMPWEILANSQRQGIRYAKMVVGEEMEKNKDKMKKIGDVSLSTGDTALTKDLPIEQARQWYAQAWAAFRHIKDGERMAIARESLEATGLDMDELHKHQWKAYHGLIKQLLRI
jgi:hypothetical protein